MNFTLGCVILFLLASQAVAQGKHMKWFMFVKTKIIHMFEHNLCLYMTDSFESISIN